MHKTSNLVALLCATAIHSVHRTSRAFIDADGIPAPNVEHYERERFVCFAEGGDGTGGEGTGGDGNQAPKTYTQAEVNALDAKRTAKLEAKFKAESEAASKALRDELDALKAQMEDAGKSAAEKAAAAAARERATVEAKLGETEKAKLAAEAKAAEAAAKLVETTLNYELQSLAAAAKVLPAMTKAALLVFRAESAIERDAEGNVVGVDIAGGKRFATVAEAFGEWMKTNGDGYVAAPAGGSGTRASSGALSSTPHMKKTNEQLIAEADALRSARR